MPVCNSNLSHQRIHRYPANIPKIKFSPCMIASFIDNSCYKPCGYSKISHNCDKHICIFSAGSLFKLQGFKRIPAFRSGLLAEIRYFTLPTFPTAWIERNLFNIKAIGSIISTAAIINFIFFFIIPIPYDK